MLEVEDCGAWLFKRNFKVEKFLRTLSYDHEFGVPRYYDSCVLDYKGSFSFKNVIITDSCIIFSEHLPKTVVLSIPFLDVENIEIIADRNSVIKNGKNQTFVSQHVRLFYKEKTVKSPEADDDSQATNNHKNENHHVKKGENATFSDEELSYSSHQNEVNISLSADTDLSRLSSVLDGTHIPSFLLQAYDPPITPILSTPFSSFSSGASSALSSWEGSRRSNKNHKGNHRQSRADSQRKQSEFENWSNYSDSLRSPSPHFSSTDFEYKHNLNTVSETDTEVGQQRDSPPLSWVGNHTIPRANGRRPRSLDFHKLSKIKHKVLGRFFPETAPLDKMLSSSTSEICVGSGESRPPSSFLRQQNTKASESELSSCQKILDFYLYQPQTILINELFLFWNRLKVNCMLRKDIFISGFIPSTRSTHSFRGAEKVFVKLSRAWSKPVFYDANSQPNLNTVLPKLETLHKALIKFVQLPRICWKNWRMITSLYLLLQRCFNMSVTDIDSDGSTDRLTAIAILMDLFRILYEATGSSWFVEGNVIPSNNNNSDLDLNKNISQDVEKHEDLEFELNEESETHFPPTNLHELTISLAISILKSLVLPQTPSWKTGGEERFQKVQDVMCTPRKFAEGRWIHSTEAKAIRAVALAHNASTALLHEILSIVHFSSKDNERFKFMSRLQSCSMEMYLRMSMTQVINLLWENGSDRSIESFHSVLLYRHIHVSQMLISSVPFVKEFLRQEFCEEFRYFIQEDSVRKIMSNRYPLHFKLMQAFGQLRQEVIDK